MVTKTPDLSLLYPPETSPVLTPYYSWIAASLAAEGFEDERKQYPLGVPGDLAISFVLASR